MSENKVIEKPVGEVHEDVHEAHPAFEPKRVICIPIDGSKDADYAVSWTIDSLANAETDQIILLNVRPFPFSSSLAYGPAAAYADFAGDNAIEEANRAESHKLLLQVARHVKEKGIHVRAIALRGDARDELVYKIEQLKPHLVVVGNRGLGRIARAFLGSVSDHLVHHLTVPVLVTRKSA